MSEPEPRGRSGLVLGILSAAAWLGSFQAYLWGSFLLMLVLMLAGIVLSPWAFIASVRGVLRARRTDEAIWPSLVGLGLSLPPFLFIAYAAIWGLIYD